ncbi:hypothetical protein GCM10009634_84460 [Saccharothrix xinjiangensis]
MGTATTCPVRRVRTARPRPPPAGRTTFDRVHDTVVSRGIPVIIGEWALLGYGHDRPGVIERGEFLRPDRAAVTGGG